MILFDLCENQYMDVPMDEDRYNPAVPDQDPRNRGMIHIAILDKYRDNAMPVRMEFEDGSAYRIAMPQDKEWFLKTFESYRRSGKEDRYYEMMGTHAGFQKLLKRYTLERAQEMHRRITEPPKPKKTASSYRKRTDQLDEQETSSNVRTRRMLDRMRMQHPQAQTDLEAILYSFDDAKKKTRADIDNLDQEIDQAENNLKNELQRKIQDINQQRGRLSDRVGDIQASDRQQQGIIDRIIKIDQDQQAALDDLEQSVKRAGSAKSRQVRQQLDTLSKTVQKDRRKSRAMPKAKDQSDNTWDRREPDTEEPIPRGFPRLATSNGVRVQPRDIKPAATRSRLQPQLPLPGVDDDLEGVARVAETQTRPQLRRIHYFRVNPSEIDLARESGLEQDRGGNWILKQYNTSGRGFDQRFTQAIRLFGRPVRSDNAESFKENNVKRIKGPHGDLERTDTDHSTTVQRVKYKGDDSAIGASPLAYPPEGMPASTHGHRGYRAPLDSPHDLDENESSMFVRELRRLYDRNEDQNRHSENALLLAKHFGTREDIQQAQAAINFRDRQGGYSMGDAEADQHMANLTRIHRQYYHHLTENIDEGLRPGEYYNYSVTFDDEESAREYTEQFLGEGVSESTYHISDFKINAYESMADFRKWMRSPKTNDRGMTRHVVDIYENIFVSSNRLTEANQTFQERKQQANQFSEKFKQFDQRDQVQIKIGNKIALLSTTVVPDDKSSRIELSGFTTPKKIVKINLDGQGLIDSIKFDDGSIFPEAAEFTTVGGVNITNTIFFPNSASASKAYTAIWMYIGNLEGKGWKVERYMSEGVSEGTLKESGETYTWTAQFADGTTKQMDIATDEVPYARAAFEKKFPDKKPVKVDTDWKPVSGSYYGGMPTSRYTEPRPRPDNPMVKEAWTLRGSKTRDNLEVKVYHDAERGRWALQMFVDGEYRPDQTQHFDNADEAKEALKILLNFGLKETIGLRGLGEAKKKPVPTNPELWSRAKSAAKSKFDVYPSAYANAWAAKWYKAKGGGWRMGKAKNESAHNLEEAEARYLGDYTYMRTAPGQPWQEYLRGEATGRILSDEELQDRQKQKPTYHESEVS